MLRPCGRRPHFRAHVESKQPSVADGLSLKSKLDTAAVLLCLSTWCFLQKYRTAFHIIAMKTAIVRVCWKVTLKKEFIPDNIIMSEK